jgi:hypothetical protein
MAPPRHECRRDMVFPPVWQNRAPIDIRRITGPGLHRRFRGIFVGAEGHLHDLNDSSKVLCHRGLVRIRGLIAIQSYSVVTVSEQGNSNIGLRHESDGNVSSGRPSIPRRRGPVMSRRFRIVLLVAIALLAVPASWFLFGPRKAVGKSGPDAERFLAAAEKVKAMEVDTIDARQFRNIRDKELEVLPGLTNLKHLNLDHAPITDEGLKQVAQVPGLQILSLTETQISDAGLAELGPLTGLKELRLDTTGITDGGLAHLRVISGLQRLSMYQTVVTDAGLAHLKRLTALLHLSLDKTLITDDGLGQLSEMPSLRYVSVWETQVTAAGVKKLEAKRPNLQINR